MAEQTSILIAGGGPVGLTLALLLQQFGVSFVVVEKEAQDSILPRARGMAVRTMEIFRQIGVEQAVQQAAASAWEQGIFGGARRGASMTASDALAIPSRKHMVERDPSPSSFCALPQTMLEPILRQALEERGGDVRRGCELVELSQNKDGVSAVLRDGRTGESTIEAQYVIGADGGRSFVRTRLGIEQSQTPTAIYYVNLFFCADLTEAMRERTFSQCEIANDSVRGLFLSKNNTTEWSFHLEYDPRESNPIEWPESALIEVLRSAIGIPDIPIELLARTKWNTRVRIAHDYQSGRVFLAGDAAHTMPPWGGFNGNTGIADAHNLAWKLALVLREDSNPEILRSYGEERRPVAIRNGRQALLRTDFDARFEIETELNRESIQQLENGGALLMRSNYGADSPELGGALVAALLAQAGTRFPHAWIKMHGRQMSTLDLFGTRHVLLQGPEARDAPEKNHKCHTPSSTFSYKAGIDFDFCNQGVNWSTLTCRKDDESLLVRPDGVVC